MRNLVVVVGKEDVRDMLADDGVRSVVDGLTCCPRNRKELERFLRITKGEDVIIVGHGTERGFLSANMDSYLIDWENSRLLEGRVVYGLWCHALDFATRHGLTGAFTSMFISNIEESVDWCVESSTDEISGFNSRFSRELAFLLREGLDHTEIPDIMRRLNRVGDGASRLVNFNLFGFQTVIDGDNSVPTELI